MPWLPQWRSCFPNIELETESGDDSFCGQHHTVYGDVATATNGCSAQRRWIFIHQAEFAKNRGALSGQLGLGRELTLHHRIELYRCFGIVGDKRTFRLPCGACRDPVHEDHDWMSV